MGIAKSCFRLLVEEAKKKSFEGKKLLQLGRQHTFLTLEQAIEVTKEAGFAYTQPKKIELSFNETLRQQLCIDDVTLFSLLGVKEVASVDVSSYEQSSFVHDLNEPIPLSWHNQYDIIFDGGTSEHIFNIPQVFKNIHALLKEGGIIIHGSPSHNHVDHGFYMFSPTLFSEYYAANSYKTQTSYIFEYTPNLNAPWKLFEYRPGCLDYFSFGGFGKQMLAIWYCGQKLPTSKSGVIPQQGSCQTQWAKKPPNPTTKSKSSNFLSLLWRRIKKTTLFRFLFARVNGKIRYYRKRRALKRVIF